MSDIRFDALINEVGTVSFHDTPPPTDGFYVSIPSMSWCSAGDTLTINVAGGLWFEAYRAILTSPTAMRWSAPARPEGSSLLYAGHWRQTVNGVARDWLDVNVHFRNEPVPPGAQNMMREFASTPFGGRSASWGPRRWNAQPSRWNNSDWPRFVGSCWGQVEIWDIAAGLQDPSRGGLLTF